MVLTLDPAPGWRTDGPRQVHGPLTLEATSAPPAAPAAHERGTLATRAGWELTLAEWTADGVTVVVAALTLADEHERAALVARCPAAAMAAERGPLLERLATARPEWPDAVVLADLLALPKI
jgi:hypothetical protein